MSKSKSMFAKLTGSLFGVIFFGIGIINVFWGNDSVYGVFVLLLSLIYFPPADAVLEKWTGFTVHPIVKILLGVFIIWSALGVGELFAKIELMKQDLFKK